MSELLPEPDNTAELIGVNLFEMFPPKSADRSKTKDALALAAAATAVTLLGITVAQVTKKVHKSKQAKKQAAIDKLFTTSASLAESREQSDNEAV